MKGSGERAKKKNWFKVSGRVPHKRARAGGVDLIMNRVKRENLFAVDLIFDLSTAAVPLHFMYLP